MNRARLSPGHHPEPIVRLQPFFCPFGHRLFTESPRIDLSGAKEGITAALKPFLQYLQFLAEGKFDWYFNSMSPRISIPDLHDLRFPKSNNLYSTTWAITQTKPGFSSCSNPVPFVDCVVSWLSHNSHLAWYRHLFPSVALRDVNRDLSLVAPLIF
jgi:hypothetical protein